MLLNNVLFFHIYKTNKIFLLARTFFVCSTEIVLKPIESDFNLTHSLIPVTLP